MPKANLRIVFDTGFYVAAALKNSYARSYVVGRGSKFLSYSVFTSEEILLELRDKLESRFGFDRPAVIATLRQIRQTATVVHPTQKLQIVRDPDDNKILECAMEAKADLVVTFDKDLLQLKELEGIKIVHPSQLKYLFLDNSD